MGSSLAIAVITLIAGIIVLIFPKILNYIVAFYLIIVGLLGILHHFSGKV